MAYGSRDDLLIVSDGHLSIANAVRTVYPGATHGLCYYHILKGMVCFGKPTKLFYKAAYAYRKSVYEKAMGSIQAARPEAYNKLMTIGPEKWARCFCPVRRYGTLTSNHAESFNNQLLWARRLPICSCLEAVRLIVEKWFVERRHEAASSTDYLTKKANAKLIAEVEKARSYTVTPISHTMFKVSDGKHTLTVDLNQKTCPCKVFDMDLIPCSHAVAAIQ